MNAELPANEVLTISADGAAEPIEVEVEHAG
jgi:hypothetical protein